ncbi:MAG TPA: heavy metal-binding domain-containing protein [Terriglobia bacterium]|nr:heavy metal-binding domain-containing protein [Terriglobia bacterium]
MRPFARFTGIILLLVIGGALAAQTPAPTMTNAAGDLVWVCPMDKDIRSMAPGNCPRCGMKLASGIPDPVEYHLNFNVSPAAPQPRKPARLSFEVHDPWKNNVVTKFSVMHEKLFHMFIVSEDLEVFVHDHPQWKDNRFLFDYSFPEPGLYRVLGDFYPEAATPQLIAKTVIIGGTGAMTPRRLTPDSSPKQAENLRVELKSVPQQPVAGQTAQLHVRVSPSEGFEKYIGAWGHMLAVSDDLIDMMHTHPVRADGPDLQFDVIFPRSRTHRVWLQFQRNGVVNTVHFDIPVK